MTTNTQRTSRLIAALDALEPYMAEYPGFGDAPEALVGEYADAILGAPDSYWEMVERVKPDMSQALIEWAQGYVERRDYPEFFALLAEVGRIRQEQGEEAAAAPEHAKLFMKTMRAAPPRYWGEAETILADTLPTATHVDDQGQPVYSAQQIADKLGVSIEDVEAGVQRMVGEGFSDGLHTGPVHPIQ